MSEVNKKNVRMPELACGGGQQYLKTRTSIYTAAFINDWWPEYVRAINML